MGSARALKADRCLLRWARSLSRQPALTTMYRLSFVTCANIAVSAGASASSAPRPRASNALHSPW